VTTNDHFTVFLGQPQKLTAVRALTGRPTGSGKLSAGVLEISADGKDFKTVATFENGETAWSGEATPVLAARIRPTADSTNLLAIREIELEDGALSHVAVAIPGQSPFGRLTVKCNFAEVPKKYAVRMRDEFDSVAGWFFTYYPKIVEMLDAPTNDLAHELTVRFRDDMKPGVPGYVSGREMTISIPHMIRDPADIRGLFIHEITHFAQAYSHGERPGWLVEGIAEAVRYRLSPPDDAWRRAVDGIEPAKLDYHKPYRDPARFLLWIEAQNQPGFIAKLSRTIKDGKYGDKTWTELTGKDPDAWLRAFREAAGK
jgi:hypothetical protein